MYLIDFSTTVQLIRLPISENMTCGEFINLIDFLFHYFATYKAAIFNYFALNIYQIIPTIH